MMQSETGRTGAPPVPSGRLARWKRPRKESLFGECIIYRHSSGEAPDGTAEAAVLPKFNCIVTAKIVAQTSSLLSRRFLTCVRSSTRRAADCQSAMIQQVWKLRSRAFDILKQTLER